MRILVLNSGSTNLKCSLFQFPSTQIAPIWQETIEGDADFSTLLKGKEFDCVGHRIVHGGTTYFAPTIIDRSVKEEIRDLASLAPLHNKNDLRGIEAIAALFPDKKQVAVFDTAFHQTLPVKAKVYPGPYAWYEKGIQRFGFHGISFQYCKEKAAEMLGKMPEKMVICHLGGGASLCAVERGKSVDTTMGFTPLEGLMMETRSGTIDPGILLSLAKRHSVEELTHILYEQSGLLGLSGVSGDMREILAKASHGHSRAQLALDVYLHRLVKEIGAMIASMGGIDALIFTGGIGEHVDSVIEKSCEKFRFLGLALASSFPKKGVLSTPRSQVQVLRIRTQEAYIIARECWQLLSKD